MRKPRSDRAEDLLRHKQRRVTNDSLRSEPVLHTFVLRPAFNLISRWKLEVRVDNATSQKFDLLFVLCLRVRIYHGCCGVERSGPGKAPAAALCSLNTSIGPLGESGSERYWVGNITNAESRTASSTLRLRDWCHRHYLLGSGHVWHLVFGHSNKMVDIKNKVDYTVDRGWFNTASVTFL